MIKTDAHQVAAAMRTSGQRAVHAAVEASNAFGARAQAVTKARIRNSGLDLDSGSEIVDSVQMVPFTGRKHIGFQVGSKREEAHRLEVGFVGIDTEGRHVDAPPFPAYRPMVNELRDAYIETVTAAVDRALHQ